MERISLLEPEIPTASKVYVNEAINTGWLSYTGPRVKMLENQVKEYVGTESAVAMSSGTGALWITLKALGIGPGDFVAVPTMTFVATVNAVIYTGATPVFIDCDKDLQMSPYHLSIATSTMGIKAVIPVHMLGNPCDMEAIEKSVHAEAFVIEDAAQALGSTYLNSDKKVGSWGLASMYSFSFNKIIAAGQGGMIVTNNTELGERLKYLSLQAKNNQELYIHNEAGFNMGMSNINAALACGQMEDIDKTLKEKDRVRNKYLELLGKENMYYEENGNGWLNAYKSKETYYEVATRCKAANIQVRPLFFPNHLQDGFLDYPYFGTHMAENKHETTICLPSSTTLTDEQIERVVKCVRGDR